AVAVIVAVLVEQAVDLLVVDHPEHAQRRVDVVEEHPARVPAVAREIVPEPAMLDLADPSPVPLRCAGDSVDLRGGTLAELRGGEAAVASAVRDRVAQLVGGESSQRVAVPR